MTSDTHPFPPYIGLGTLDELSIGYDEDLWCAEYPIGTERYIEVTIIGGRVEIEEFGEDGRRVATTFESTLTRAIGLHGQGALDGQTSRIWTRAARLAGSVWVQVSVDKVRFSYVPAIALGRLCVPSPLDQPWISAEPGPLARRLGFAPFAGPDCTVEATLLRIFDGDPEPTNERVWLHQDSIPVILLAETVAALYAANGPLRSIEWRPFVNPEPALWVSQHWYAPVPTPAADGRILTGFALIAPEYGVSTRTIAAPELSRGSARMTS